MGRWTGWSSARWAIILLAGLLVLALTQASRRIAADGAEQTAAKSEKPNESSQKLHPPRKTKREALRYGGKNFDQWRVELETELKPELHADGLAAMGAFGANGYGTEAARVIVDLMKGYQLVTTNEKDAWVVAEAFEAVRKIDKPAFPVLWESLKSDNRRTRLFAIACVTNSVTSLSFPFARDLDCEIEKHVPELLKGVKHEDAKVREGVLGKLTEVDHKPKDCIPLLLPFLSDKEESVRWQALQNLAGMLSDEPEVLSALSKTITGSDGFRRLGALQMAARYGAKAKPTLPAMMELLDNPKRNDFDDLMKALAAIGPDAREALPRLHKLRKQVSSSDNPFNNGFGAANTGDVQLLDQTIKKIEGK